MNELKIRVERLIFSQNTELRKTIVSIIEDYIENSEDTYYIDKIEYEKTKEYLDELYTIPIQKNRKPAISEEVYLKLISRLVIL